MEMNFANLSEEVKARKDFIDKEIGMGNVINDFGYKGNPQIKSVTDTGLIVLWNKATGIVKTILIARPKQLRRLYESAGGEVPKSVIRLAYDHNRKGYNLK